jgi:Domain of unknown function (DUF4328)
MASRKGSGFPGQHGVTPMTHDPYAPPTGPTPPAALPPAQYTYGPPLYALPPLRSAAGLGTAAIVLACVWTAVQVLRLALAPSAAEALRRAGEAGVGAFNSEFTGYDAVGIPFIAVEVATYVVACVWLYRSRSTAVAANPGHVHERSAVWTWLGWWVPIVSFWFPYQVVRDVRRASASGRISGIGGWWAAWLVFVIASSAAGRMATRTTPEATLIAAEGLMYVELVATVAMVVALVLWIRIIQDVTRYQAERITAAQQGQA